MIEKMNEKVITLPDRETMFQNLVEVDDMHHLQERFYPILLERAGETKVARGVIMMLALAIRDYSNDLSFPEMIQDSLLNRMEFYLRALIEDEEVLNDAITTWGEILKSKE